MSRDGSHRLVSPTGALSKTLLSIKPTAKAYRS
jgi:hypothetical protein